MSEPTVKEIELEALKTEREGMIALNQYREHLGAGIAYDEMAFFQK